MRTLIFCLFLLTPLLALGTGCTDERSQKPKPGVVDTSNPSNIVIPDQMKKNAPNRP